MGGWLVDNDFRQATLIDTSFKYGIDIDRQRWPEGPAYRRIDRIGERLARMGEVIPRWPEGPEKDRAKIWLRIYQNEARDQREIFVRTDDVLEDAPELRQRLWKMLESL